MKAVFKHSSVSEMHANIRAAAKEMRKMCNAPTARFNSTGIVVANHRGERVGDGDTFFVDDMLAPQFKQLHAVLNEAAQKYPEITSSHCEVSIMYNLYVWDGAEEPPGLRQSDFDEDGNYTGTTPWGNYVPLEGSEFDIPIFELNPEPEDRFEGRFRAAFVRELGFSDILDTEMIAGWYTRDESEWDARIEDAIQHHEDKYGLVRVPEVMAGVRKIPYHVQLIMSDLKKKM